ncbi:hypothetical protein [Parashewanella tropica]|uniref:hypothetical protein n=1 Tax=Parashewanella tropica TaxID=2547970 RepID=UPI00105AA099|nr:hypothetical protein [Parashewanella tropica]
MSASGPLAYRLPVDWKGDHFDVTHEDLFNIMCHNIFSSLAESKSLKEVCAEFNGLLYQVKLDKRKVLILKRSRKQSYEESHCLQLQYVLLDYFDRNKLKYI